MAPIETQLNHFKIWKVATKKFQRGVTLLGQFDKERQDAVIEAAEWLANPVQKKTKKFSMQANTSSATF